MKFKNAIAQFLLISLPLTPSLADLAIDNFALAAPQVTAGTTSGNSSTTGAAQGVTTLLLAGQRFLVADAKEFAPPPFPPTASGESAVEIASSILSVTLENSNIPANSDTGLGLEFPSGRVIYNGFASPIDFTSFAEDAFRIDVANSQNMDLQVLLKDSTGNESASFFTIPDSASPQTILRPIFTSFAGFNTPAADLTDIIEFSIRLDLTSRDLSTDTAFAEISNISFVAAIPEPGMLGLGAIGFAVLACYKRRKFDSLTYEKKEQPALDRF